MVITNGDHFEMARNERSKGRERQWHQPVFHFLEIILFGGAVFMGYLIHFTPVFRAVPVDFDPTDVTISKPLIPRLNRTVSTLATVLYITIPPSVTIVFVETILMMMSFYRRKGVPHVPNSVKCCATASIIRTIRFVEMHLFGLLLTSILCDAIVKTLPSLSPNFLSVCKTEKQDMIKEAGSILIGNLTNPSDLRSARIFLSRDCRPTQGEAELRESRMEFPSYYVCLTTFTSAYMFLYFRVIFVDTGPALKSLILWTTGAFPYVLGLLEIAEYTSHVISVIGGWILGIGVAILAARGAFTPDEKIAKKYEIRPSFRASRAEPNNIFEVASRANYVPREYGVRDEDAGDDDTVLSNRDDEEEILHHKSRVALDIAPSPAISKISRSTTHTVEDEARRGYTAERNVIKELQDYMLETDFRGGVESPKPTQIRQRTRGVSDGRRQTVLSTFQAEPKPMSEECSPRAGEQEVQGDIQPADDQLNVPAIDLPVNFQRNSPHEMKLSSSYNKPPEGLGWLSDQESLVSPAIYKTGRPLSYNYLATDDPYNLQVRFQTFSNKAATLDGSTSRPMYCDLQKRCEDPRFGNSLTDGESDVSSLEKASSTTSPAVTRHNGAMCRQIPESDIVNETSNLLSEVFDLMNEANESEEDSEEDFSK